MALTHCPRCNDTMIISQLKCPGCALTINADIPHSRLTLLPKDQLEFIEIFLKHQGSIKAVEKELGISYPTVKKKLNEVLRNLGHAPAGDDDAPGGKKNLVDWRF